MVTRVSPPIFALQHCCRFHKQMQLNMGGLPLNTLFLYFLLNHLYLFFLFFFLKFSSFCSLYSSFSYFLLQPMLILTGLSWCHKFQPHFMSLMPQIERSSRLSVHQALLDWDERLVVTRVSPPIFGLKHCCRFRKQMQLNMGGLRLNTLFLHFLFHHLYLFFLFFFFNFSSFCSLYFFFFIFSFSLC